MELPDTSKTVPLIATRVGCEESVPILMELYPN